MSAAEPIKFAAPKDWAEEAAAEAISAFGGWNCTPVGWVEALATPIRNAYEIGLKHGTNPPSAEQKEEDLCDISGSET